MHPTLKTRMVNPVLRALRLFGKILSFLLGVAVIVFFVGLFILFMKLAHVLFSTNGASPTLYWLGMICTFVVLAYFLVPWFLILPDHLTPEERAKFNRL